MQHNLFSCQLSRSRIASGPTPPFQINPHTDPVDHQCISFSTKYNGASGPRLFRIISPLAVPIASRKQGRPESHPRSLLPAI